MIVRGLQILWAAMLLLVGALADQARFRSRASAHQAARLRSALERLGPTFVKLGQALSQRPDILPPIWVRELARLRENVPPFPSEIAVRTVETALGRPVREAFREFDPEPLAAGSVAQVHAARMRDGQDVVVKVVRPGVRDRIDKDMRILLRLTRVATAIVPALHDRRAPALVQEIWRKLSAEVDMRQEARNARRFARAFEGSTTICIPQIVEQAHLRDVLIQQRSHGRRLGEPRPKAEASRLAEAFIDFYLQQFFVVGAFHADPHPGNIFVLGDGRLCFHDFGAVGVLDAPTRRALLGFLQAFMAQDPEWLADAATDLGLISSLADRDEMARGVEELLVDLAGSPIEEWSIGQIMLQITRLGGSDALALPPHLAALVRTVLTAEGTLRLIDPQLNVIETMKARGAALIGGPDLKTNAEAGFERLKWEGALAVQSAPAAAARGLRALRRANGELGLHLPEVAEAADRIGRAADRIAFALVALGLYVAASLLMQHSIGPRLFGDLPVLAAAGYAVALWFTLQLVRGIGRRD